MKNDFIKPIRICVLHFIFTTLVQCSMNSADVRKGDYLEVAKETSIEEFFEKRMKNKIKKVLGANWEILFESSEFVYFGYPLISFFREGTFLDEIFKVNKTNLEREFPSYKSFDGITMRTICRETIYEYIKSINSKIPDFFDCKASLEKEVILIYVDLNFKTNENKYKIEKYLIRFDKKNLKKDGITKLDQ